MKVVKRLVSLVLAFLLALLIPIGSASAAQPSDATLRFYNENGIRWYNALGGGALCYSGTLSGDTIMAKVVTYLKGNNPNGFVLSDNGIAGILANFQRESGFNPFRFQGDKRSGPGYGIAQFTDSKGGGIDASPILPSLRTLGYFNEYFDVKYTYTDESTGFPKEPVPMDVIDAWLLIQLDYFFGPSSEFETTKVGTYRHRGGEMGLNYISDSMTAREAMDAAQSPEDAARVFVWIMERPGNKAGESTERGQKAAGWLDYIQRLGVTAGAGVGDTTVSGSKVTIIGDEIALEAASKLEQELPGVDIHAQAGMQFYSGGGGTSGIDILRDLANSNSLRETVVYALGTNGNFTLEQAQEVVNTAGSSRKVIFVTNWTVGQDYTANNNVLTRVENDNSNVSIADWESIVESQPDTYLLGDGVLPSEEGQAMFAQIIKNVVSTSNGTFGACSGGLIEGGMDESQAQRLADYYNSSEITVSEWRLPAGTKRNCVSFSAFFVQRFTTIGKRSGPWGDGRDTAHKLAVDEGLPEGTEPRPYAVFSVTSGTLLDDYGVPYGHTGIVVGVEGDKIITVEAAYGKNGKGHDAIVKTRDPSYFVNVNHGNTFTYLDSILNQFDLSQL